MECPPHILFSGWARVVGRRETDTIVVRNAVLDWGALKTCAKQAWTMCEW